MNKKIIGIIVIIVIVISIMVTIFCMDVYKKELEKILLIEIDVESKMEEILNNEKVSKEIDKETLVLINEDIYASLYDIDLNLLESYYGKTPMIGLKSNEIVIVKVKDVNDITIVEDKFRKRAENVASNFENYLENEYEIARNPLVYSKGKYVIFAISSNNEIIKAIFENSF